MEEPYPPQPPPAGPGRRRVNINAFNTIWMYERPEETTIHQMTKDLISTVESSMLGRDAACHIVGLAKGKYDGGATPCEILAGQMRLSELEPVRGEIVMRVVVFDESLIVAIRTAMMTNPELRRFINGEDEPKRDEGERNKR